MDASSCDDGVTYEGLVEYVDEDAPQTYAIDVEGKAGYAFKFGLEKKHKDEDSSDGESEIAIAGGLEVKLELSTKVYISLNLQYLELKFDYSGKIFADITGEISSEIPLVTVAFIPVTGVIVELTPSIVLEAETKISFEGVLKGTIGLRVQSGEGITNLTSMPKFKPSIKMEGSIFVGLSLCPRVKILSDKVASASLKGKVGAEVKVSRRDPYDESEKKRHECDLCYEGEINGKIELSASVKLLNKKKYTVTPMDIAIKISDFYYSSDKDSMGWSSCPYCLLLGKVIVMNSNEKPMQYVNVKLSANETILTTNKNGEVEFWLPEGEQAMEISRTNYKTVNRVLLLESGGECLRVVMQKAEKEESDGSGNVGGSDTGDVEGGEVAEGIGILQVSLGLNCSAAITQEGDLYLWGQNDRGRLGDGTTTNSDVPKKIMSGVKAVDIGDTHSAAITENGDLYLWGANYSGQLGDGTTTDGYVPKKIMSGVKAVDIGNSHSAAITEGGDLYLWGSGSSGELGDGKTSSSYIPKKIMSGVKAVSLGNTHSAAITEEGDLYLWGSGSSGELGDGKTSSSYIPKKIMSGIKAVSLGTAWAHSAAITETGELYTWGYNNAGQLGDGTTISSYVPKKIMDNVKMVSLVGYRSAAITEDGNLYMWGNNSDGELGDGTEAHSYVPKKIMSAVRTVSLGYHHSALITKAGDLYLWGDNNNGSFGNGTWTSSNVPIRIDVPFKEESTEAISLFSMRSILTQSINGTGTVLNDNTNWNGTSFINLLPNETYNYYVMQDRDAEQPFSIDNLLYIGQVDTDEEGALEVAFSAEVASAGEDIFAIPMHQMDLSDAEVSVEDLTYNGEEQYAEILVYYGDKLLVEGVDYNVTGEYGVTQVGDYTLKVEGRGLYVGTISASYKVLSDIDQDTDMPENDHVHTDIEHVKAVPATCMKEGTKEYWTCASSRCAGKYYGDANCQIELTDITLPKNSDNHVENGSWSMDTKDHIRTCACGVKVIEGVHVYDDSKDAYCNTCNYKRYYIVTSGADAVYTFNDSEGLIFKIDGDHTLFQALKIDGAVVASENYTLAKGSTIITLKDTYLDTLEAGTHKLEAIYSDGKVAMVEFKIEADVDGENTDTEETVEWENSREKDNVPKTGENSPIALLIAICVCVSATTLTFRKRKS